MDRIETKICALIDAHADEIIDFAEDIYTHPEEGFYEERTAAKVAGFLRAIGLDVHAYMARTGVRGDWMEQDGPNVTIIGEMDAIGCRTHPMADFDTGVAHACGHHAQIAAMIGAAIALMDDQVKASMRGSVSFFAVPAEEYVDAKKRRILKERENIGFPGSGKSELVRIGAFDPTDIALTTHVHMVPVEEDLYLGNPACNGFAAEMVTVRGKAAHAAICPWEGVNAVSIATSALNMIGLMRETFQDDNHVRVHSLVRKGGEVLNSVPDEVIMEEKVRSKTLEGIRDAKAKLDRAFDGAAYAFGGTIERENLQGYMPVLYRPADSILIEAAKQLGVSYRTVKETDFNNASTDVGDLTHLMPVLNFTFHGFAGKLHGADFEITDPVKAYLIPAKMLALSTYKLLKNGAAGAREILQGFQPVFDKEGYISYVEKALL
ncbi:MAG: amidohydrolase [Blautia sp.]